MALSISQEEPLYTREEVAQRICHMLLRPDLTEKIIRRLCSQAITHNFAAVCVNPTWVEICNDQLGPTHQTKVCSTVGYPFGTSRLETKVLEAKTSFILGAHELKVAINTGALLSGDRGEYVSKEISAIHRVFPLDYPVNIILNRQLLADDNIFYLACSTVELTRRTRENIGISIENGNLDDIALVRKFIGPEMPLEVFGDFRGWKDAENMLTSGADRLGCLNERIMFIAQIPFKDDARSKQEVTQ